MRTTKSPANVVVLSSSFVSRNISDHSGKRRHEHIEINRRVPKLPVDSDREEEKGIRRRILEVVSDMLSQFRENFVSHERSSQKEEKRSIDGELIINCFHT